MAHPKLFHNNLCRNTESISNEDFLRISHEVLLRVDTILREQFSDPDIFACLDFVLRNKFKNPFETRVNWFYLAYTMLEGRNREEFICMAAAYEIVLLSMYNFNLQFDRKGPQELREKPHNLIIGGILLHNTAVKLVLDFSFDNNVKHIVISELVKVSTVFFEGEFSDLNRNVFLRETGEILFDMKEYWRRVYMVNAHMYESLSRSAMIVSGVHSVFREALVTAGRFYGYVIQLVNDIADFVPATLQTGTDEKIPQDAYADIRNRRVTLPFHYFWQTLRGDERKEVIERFDDLVDSRNEELARWMIRNGAIKRAQEAVHRVAHKYHILIKQFPQQFQETFRSMVSMAYSNRFYTAFKSLK